MRKKDGDNLEKLIAGRIPFSLPAFGRGKEGAERKDEQTNI
jgi:hypothetical protein